MLEPNSLIVIGDIMLDCVRHRIEKLGVKVHLTPKEFDLLSYLMAHAGRPVSRHRLLTTIGVRSMEANVNMLGS
jgi:two-component system, OmpR family, KDP operon response regulator KdpE